MAAISAKRQLQPTLFLSISWYLPSLFLVIYARHCYFKAKYTVHLVSLLFSMSATFTLTRDGIFQLLRGPGVDSMESIPPAYVAWRAGTTTLFFLGS